jgi:hypothetical protein
LKLNEDRKDGQGIPQRAISFFDAPSTDLLA